MDLSLDTDRQILGDVISYFDKLRGDTNICIALEFPSLSKMLADKSLLIQDEGVRRRPRASDADAPEESDSPGTTEDVPPQPLFGKSQFKKRTTPGLIGSAPAKRPPRKPAPIAGSIPGQLPDESAIKRWYKQMDGTAAQHPPSAASNPTGNLRLSQEIFPIDHRTYFLSVFFGGLIWRPVANKSTEYEVWVPMDVEVDGDYLGEINIRISHDPNRISGQGNVPTVLH